uniref:Replication-associated protein n=1 Tax=Cressdnaviricota sp. TaxID=2748378 RepID=A0A6M3YPA3_9VIRU|nr:MAG: replication-associated protein [Cressdnaviricota sp.]
MGSRTRGYILTIYPQLDEDLPWDPQTIAWTWVKPAIEHFVCQLEEAPKTGRIHWQCAVEFKTSVTFEQVQKCTAWVGVTSPHIERRKGTALQAAEYCRKDESCVDRDCRFEYGVPAAERPNREQVYREAIQAPNLSEAIELIKHGAPRDFVLHYEGILRSLREIHQTATTNPCWNWEFNIPKVHKTILERYSVFLYGPSNTGKTSFALSHFQNPCLVRHIDDAKKISAETDGLVFDDMSFKHWPRTSCIHILDLEHDAPLPTRYATTTIRAGLPRFFTSNETFADVFNLNGNNGQELGDALRRRTKRYRILSTLVVSKTHSFFRYWDLYCHRRCTMATEQL